MDITINPDRLKQVTTLKHGGHSSPEDGMCLLESAAWIAGEPFTDRPPCVDPVLGAFGRQWNDNLRTDEDRARLLLPFAARLPGTARPDEQVREKRSLLALDWLIRTHTVEWLRLTKLDDIAQQIADLEPITDMATAKAAGTLVREAQTQAAAARDAAWDAARAAARDAAWAAAWDAAGDAAGDAARAAAGDAARDAARAAARDAARDAARAAAGDAARAAAGDAARAAARDAARAAARAALAPTVAKLQDSAVDLFDRMILVAPGPELAPELLALVGAQQA